MLSTVDLKSQVFNLKYRYDWYICLHWFTKDKNHSQDKNYPNDWI